MSGNETNEGYALVTPAKNEEANLLKVAEAVVNQTVTPRLWVIVDDGSTDRTQQIIRDLQGNQSWIVASSLPEHRRDINVHYAEVCKHGFDVAIRYLEEHDISYEFLGLIDADTVVESRYFEKLIGEFRRDRGLGVASGGLF